MKVKALIEKLGVGYLVTLEVQQKTNEKKEPQSVLVTFNAPQYIQEMLSEIHAASSNQTKIVVRQFAFNKLDEAAGFIMAAMATESEMEELRSEH